MVDQAEEEEGPSYDYADSTGLPNPPAHGSKNPAWGAKRGRVVVPTGIPDWLSGAVCGRRKPSFELFPAA